MESIDRSTNTILGGAWTNVILGLIVAAVPFFTAVGIGAFWSNVVVGLLIAILAGYNVWAARNAVGTVAWTGGINVLLGLWLIVSPFIYAAGMFYLWSNVILGAIIALVAAYNSWAGTNARRRVAGRAS